MRGLLLVFTLSRAPEHRGGDRWLAPDKLQHFFTSAFVQSLSYGVLRRAGVDNGNALAGASVITLGAGVGKEVFDRRVRGEFSLRDLAWDAAGAGSASVLLARTVK